MARREPCSDAAAAVASVKDVLSPQRFELPMLLLQAPSAAAADTRPHVGHLGLETEAAKRAVLMVKSAIKQASPPKRSSATRAS